MIETIDVVGTAVEVKEEETSFANFEEMVTYFRGKVDTISKITLRTCWEIGKEVKLIKESAVYGEKTVENFASEMDINIKGLYRYAQFASEYTEAELEVSIAKDHIGWGVVNKLISVKDKEDRSEFEDKIAEGEIKPSQLDEEISVYMSGLAAGEDASEEGEAAEAPAAPARRNYNKNIKKCAASLEILNNLLPLVLKDLDDADDIAGDDDKYTKYIDNVYTLRENIEAAEPKLTQVKERAALLA